MSKKQKLYLLAMISFLIMACSCNFGNYLSNLFNAVEDTLDDNGEEVTELVEPEFSDQDPNPVEEAEEVLEEIQPVIEDDPAGLTRPALLIQLPTRLLAGDDTGMKPTEMYSGEFIQQVSIAPSDALVAFVTSQKEYGMGEISLRMLDLNTGEVSLITPLTNEKTTQTSVDGGDLGESVREANIALMFDNLAWSPDGAYLAFVGAQQSDQAHVYTYETATGTIARLFGDESHHYKPSWSPDGRYVVAPSAFGFGTGAGFSMDAVWSARPDGSEGKLLYDASDSSNETIWGWFDGHTFIVSSVDMMAGHQHLRAFDIETNAVAFEILGPSDYFSSVAIAEENRSVMFDFPFSDMAEFVEGETITKDGLYFWKQGVEGYEQLNDVVDWNSNVVWDGTMQCFYAKVPKRAVTEDFIQPYTADGQIDGEKCPAITSIAEEAPVFAPSGQQYVWIATSWNHILDEGLYSIRYGEFQETLLADGQITQALWHPEEDVLFFVTGDYVYQVQGEDQTVSLVSNTVGESVQSIGWVLP